MTTSRQSYETLEGQGYVGVRQLSVFMENRLGQILRLTQTFERKEVKILGLSVVDSVDCAIVRLMCNDPDEALDVLKEAGFAVSITEVLVVRLPPGKRGLLSIFSTLLTGEINISYTYPLLVAVESAPAVVLAVDNIEIAVEALRRKNFQVLSEPDLKSGL